MPVLGAFGEGWRRVVQAPVLVIGTAIAIGVATSLLETARPHPDQAFLTASWLPGGHTAWGYTIQVLYLQARILSAAVAPEFARFFEPGGVPPSWIASLLIQSAFWLFLTGGILDRLARGRPVRGAAFFAACGVYFFRFLRLVLIAAVPGWVLFRALHAFAGNVYVHLGVLLVVMAAGVVLDFAKARAVVEDRLSMIGALAAGYRFIVQRFWRVLALTLLNALTILAVLRLQVQVFTTPGPEWLCGLLWALVTLAAVAGRLAVLASQVVFFQGELAHAGYTAAPIPPWPDSPAVEALQNLSNRGGDRSA